MARAGRPGGPSATSRPGRKQPAADLPGGPAHSLVVSVHITFPGRQADAEAGRSPSRDRGREVGFPAGQAGVGQPQPDHFDGALPRALPGRSARSAARRRASPAWSRVARMGGLPVGHRDQPQPGAGGGEQGDGPARAEHLIIGMSGQDRRRWSSSRQLQDREAASSCGQARQAASLVPGASIGLGRPGSSLPRLPRVSCRRHGAPGARSRHARRRRGRAGSWRNRAAPGHRSARWSPRGSQRCARSAGARSAPPAWPGPRPRRWPAAASRRAPGRRRRGCRGWPRARADDRRAGDAGSATRPGSPGTDPGPGRTVPRTRCAPRRASATI